MDLSVLSFRNVSIALGILIGLNGAFAEDDWSHFKRATRDDYESAAGAPDGASKIIRYDDREAEGDDVWLAPAVNVNPRRKKPRAGWNRLTTQLYCYSYPSSASLQSILNPWGEQTPIFKGPIDELASRTLAACEVYRYQQVHFDGYLESTDDGRHLMYAADGNGIAVWGDNEARRYRRVVQSLPDTLDERCWICVDLPIFALNLAGFPIREAMIAHFFEDPALYMHGGLFKANVPDNQFFFRRVDNLRLYLKEKQFYSEDKITIEQYLDPDYRPPAAFRPGDVIFMGHYHSETGKKPFEAPKHSGIVESVDERGMPLRLFNMRTSNQLIDYYDGPLHQTRNIRGTPIYFARFCDRYSIIGHGRIVRPFEPPSQGMPTINMVQAFLEKRRQEEEQARQVRIATSEHIERTTSATTTVESPKADETLASADRPSSETLNF